MAQGFNLCDLGSANVDNAFQFSCGDGLNLPALDEPQLLQQGPASLASLQAGEITEASLSSNGFDLPALDVPQQLGCSHACCFHLPVVDEQPQPSPHPSPGPEDLFNANNLVESSIAYWVTIVWHPS